MAGCGLSQITVV